MSMTKFDTEVFKDCEKLNDLAEVIEKNVGNTGNIPEDFVTANGIKKQYYDQLDEDPDREFFVVLSLMQEGDAHVTIMYVIDMHQNYIHDHVVVDEGNNRLAKFYSPHIDKTFIRCYDLVSKTRMDYSLDGDRR